MIRTFILSFTRGLLMGATDIVPGVSGGTVALVLGIYGRLIASISAGSKALGSLVKGDWGGFKSWLGKVEWPFFIPLVLGIATAIFALAHLITTLLTDQPVLMAALFVGLVAGSVVIVWVMIRERSATLVLIALAAAVTSFAILGLRSSTSEDAVTQVADPALWVFFFSAAIAICAMILPGISGSFVLVMLGMYGPVLAAVKDLDIAVIVTFVLGATLGLALFSQFLNWALHNHHDLVLAILVGLMGGSLRVLWPWPLGVESTHMGTPDSQVGQAVVMAVIGFVVVVAVSWTAAKLDPEVQLSSVAD